ncbi:MAG: hydantoinase/carbamoylase family amidase [Proteobacteria bacterium]|nr:hydantoinase/carbamoylase family amidase [Burkholderiales bacterium]
MDSVVERLDSSLLALAERVFDEVRQATFDGVGVSRASYGEGESRALAILDTHARAAGLCCTRDAVENLVISAPDEPAGPVVLIGSHLDSVPQGGNFDGLAGVVAGLLILLHYRRQNIAPPRPIRVLALRGEESAWYGKAYMGSLALTGQLTGIDLDLRQRESGRTLREDMQSLGIATERIEAGEPLIDAAQVEAYLELHIEQGPTMVARQWAVAPVTGIRGNIRHNRIVCKGEGGHSGAVPRWLRKDAVLAVAELMTRLDEHWRVLQQMGMDMVMTCGIVSTDPKRHAVSVIPGEVSFSFEVRSQEHDVLERFHRLMQEECERIGRSRGVEFLFDRQLYTAPATMDARWVERLSRACATFGLDMEPMPSGAGHDAAVFANAGVACGMVFVRNDRGSHNPYEAMDLQDFFHGVEVLHRAIVTD